MDKIHSWMLLRPAYDDIPDKRVCHIHLVLTQDYSEQGKELLIPITPAELEVLKEIVHQIDSLFKGEKVYWGKYAREEQETKRAEAERKELTHYR